MSLRDDPELGRVRLCGTCHEEWPFDADFWHLINGALNPAWPARCIACCAEYYAQRRRLAQQIAKSERVFLIPAAGRCGAKMSAGRVCGRHAGHLARHRSVAAMRDEAERKRDSRVAA